MGYGGIGSILVELLIPIGQVSLNISRQDRGQVISAFQLLRILKPILKSTTYESGFLFSNICPFL